MITPPFSISAKPRLTRALPRSSLNPSSSVPSKVSVAPGNLSGNRKTKGPACEALPFVTGRSHRRHDSHLREHRRRVDKPPVLGGPVPLETNDVDPLDGDPLVRRRDAGNVPGMGSGVAPVRDHRVALLDELVYLG